MNNLAALILITLATRGFSGEMPNIIPDPPPESKPVSEYSAADVFSISSVNPDDLTANHPYVQVPKYHKVIVRDWPGTKNPQMIDEFVGFILLSPGRNDEGADTRSALENNVSYIMCEIMDVTREAKVDALLRVIASQSDPVKKSLARRFACDMFKVLLDPRLIYPMRDEFTNTEVWEDPDVPERDSGNLEADTPQIESAKSEAVGLITSALECVGFDFDDPIYYTVDHDADCVRIGQWLDANAALVEQKCLQARNGKKKRKWSGYCVEWDIRQD